MYVCAACGYSAYRIQKASDTLVPESHTVVSCQVGAVINQVLWKSNTAFNHNTISPAPSWAVISCM